MGSASAREGEQREAEVESLIIGLFGAGQDVEVRPVRRVGEDHASLAGRALTERTNGKDKFKRPGEGGDAISSRESRLRLSRRSMIAP